MAPLTEDEAAVHGLQHPRLCTHSCVHGAPASVNLFRLGTPLGYEAHLSVARPAVLSLARVHTRHLGSFRVPHHAHTCRTPRGTWHWQESPW